MGYEIAITPGKGYVRLDVSGAQTLEDNLELIAVAMQACRRHHADRMLVDIRSLVGQPGTVADFELAKASIREARGVVRKAALLHRLETSEYTAFFTTTVRNRGLNMNTFSEEAEALAWLLDD